MSASVQDLASKEIASNQTSFTLQNSRNDQERQQTTDYDKEVKPTRADTDRE